MYMCVSVYVCLCVPVSVRACVNSVPLYVYSYPIPVCLCVISARPLARGGTVQTFLERSVSSGPDLPLPLQCSSSPLARIILGQGTYLSSDDRRRRRSCSAKTVVRSPMGFETWTARSFPDLWGIEVVLCAPWGEQHLLLWQRAYRGGKLLVKLRRKIDKDVYCYNNVFL